LNLPESFRFGSSTQRILDQVMSATICGVFLCTGRHSGYWVSWNSQGAAEWNVYESGESVVVQPNAPHTFFNKSEHPCRMLIVSTYHHERMMKDAVQPDGRTDFLPAQLSQARF
jgi:hypothetical protein